MFKTIAIYWKHNFDELLDLPNVRMVKCGNNGLEVLSTAGDIAELVQAVKKEPGKFSLGAEPEDAAFEDFLRAAEFSQGNWPEFDGVEDVKDYLLCKSA